MLTVRHIATKTNIVVGEPLIVPALDEHGAEVVVWSVDVPREIEAEGAAAIDAYVVERTIAASPVAAVTTDTQESGT